MNRYFIPKTVMMNRVLVPSVPFKDKDSNDIFIGDVIKIEIIDEGEKSTEHSLVALIDGVYCVVNKDKSINTPMYMVERRNISVVGNSHEKPELLELLSD